MMRRFEVPEDTTKTIEQKVEELLFNSLSKQELRDLFSKRELRVHGSFSKELRGSFSQQELDWLDSFYERVQKSQKSQLWHKSCSSLSQFLAKGLDEENRAHYTDLQNGWFEAHPRRVAWLLSFKFLAWDRLAVWLESMLLKISLIQRFISS